MSGNSQIISQVESLISVSSVHFLKLPDILRPDFNIFVPFDVNGLFESLEIVVPRYDDDAGDHLTPDQKQETVGAYDNTLWRGVYEGNIMGELAEKIGRYDADTAATPARQLKILMEKIICELFLGKQLGDPAVFGDADGSGLTLKTDEYIKPWLNGSITDGWGEKCFVAEQFDTITTQLVAANKFSRVMDTTNTTETHHGKVNLAVNDCIGVRVKLEENPDNFLYVNFYLQQTDPQTPLPAVPTLITPHNLTSNTSDPTFIISTSSNFSGYDGYLAFDNTFDQPNVWMSASGTLAGQESGAPTALNTFNGVNGPYLKISLDQPKMFDRYRVAVPSYQPIQAGQWRLLGSNHETVGYEEIYGNVAMGIYNAGSNYESWINIGPHVYKYIVLQITHGANLGGTGWDDKFSVAELDFGTVPTTLQPGTALTIPVLTSNTSGLPEILVSASSTYQMGPWAMYNQIPSQAWSSASGTYDIGTGLATTADIFITGTYGSWFKVSCNVTRSVSNYAIYESQNRSWRVLGSNDTSSWDVVDEQEDIPAGSVGSWSVFTLPETVNYQFYVVQVTKTGIPRDRCIFTAFEWNRS